MNESLKDLAMAYQCPYCLAWPREWCVTSGGFAAVMLHSDRTNPIYSAYGMGYQECDDWARQRAAS